MFRFITAESRIPMSRPEAGGERERGEMGVASCCMCACVCVNVSAVSGSVLMAWMVAGCSGRFGGGSVRGQRFAWVSRVGGPCVLVVVMWFVPVCCMWLSVGLCAGVPWPRGAAAARAWPVWPGRLGGGHGSQRGRRWCDVLCCESGTSCCMCVSVFRVSQGDLPRV
jgi:hypothetical protein